MPAHPINVLRTVKCRAQTSKTQTTRSQSAGLGRKEGQQEDAMGHKLT